MKDTRWKPENASGYHTAGSISFSMLRNEKLNCKQLAALVKDVDRQHPWVCHDRDGRPADSIGSMGVDAKKADDRVNRNYTVTVSPHYLLRLDQISPYEEYLNTLAGELSRRVKGVYAVESWVKLTRRGSRHLTPEGQKSLEETMTQPAMQQLADVVCRAR